MKMALGHGGRSLSMGALISEDILEPGEKVLTFDYMGRRYEADLLPSGLISWNGSTYSSPYAWASQCKNLVNPDHKSGIGWGHIRYKGVKLSQFKTIYLRKHGVGTPSSDQDGSGDGASLSSPTRQIKRRRKRQPLREQELHFKTSAKEVHSSLQLLSNTQESSSSPAVVARQSTPPAPQMAEGSRGAVSLLECTPFTSLGLQQPFSVDVSSNVLLLMDFHSHLSSAEVLGYLGGHYDPSAKALEVLQAFPCRSDSSSAEKEVIPWIESACSNSCQYSHAGNEEIQAAMADKGQELVGWYHSHPFSEPRPSQNDVLSHRSHQEAMRRESMEEPCVAFLVSPNHSGRLEETSSSFAAFWVLTLQQDGGIKASPMHVKYSLTWEQYLTQDVVDEMGSLAAYYNAKPEKPNFSTAWRSDLTLLQKLKASLSSVQPKFPQENSDVTFMSYIDQLILQ